MFAVERIKSLTPTDHPYQMPLHFDLDAFVQDALTVMRGQRIDVELLFNKATAAWVKDRVWHPSQDIKFLKNGQLRMHVESRRFARTVGVDSQFRQRRAGREAGQFTGGGRGRGQENRRRRVTPDVTGAKRENVRLCATS